MSIKPDDLSTTAMHCLQNTSDIESITNFLEYVYYLQQHWDNNELWFRGVSKSSYKLVPSIYRQTVWKYKSDQANDIYFEFIRKARSCLSDSCSKWEWYHIMQHYGLPTRLLDWTEGALIALFFATRKLAEVDNPSVWVIDPYWINKSSSGREEVFWTDSLAPEQKIPDLYIESHEKKELPKYPLCLLPSHTNERIRAQRSCFSVHGRYKDGFKRLCRDKADARLAKLVICTDCAQKIKQELVSAGVKESTLFPDLEGIAREIKDEFELN
jgi:hypothetical protein